MTPQSPHCIVIGAGIVGLSTAIWLARSGHQVTVIDRLDPGEGTSHGNAGVLASCSMVPVTTPGLISKAPGMLLDADSPLFLRWSYLLRLAPWLTRYLSHANDQSTRHAAEHLTFIVGDSLEQHQDLAGNTVADRWLVPSDYQFAYHSMADYKADAYAWALREQHGFIPTLLRGDAVREREPGLSHDIDVLAVLNNHGTITSPGRYVKSLAEVFAAMGGVVRRGQVEQIHCTADHVNGVITDQGRIDCDQVVIATGVWSKSLTEPLGIRVPMESERGYHIIFKNPSVQVSVPTMMVSSKFVATPMYDGMRCAGVVEFGGLDAGPSAAPIAMMRRQVARCFPSLEYSESVEWMGHRPAPSDSLPLIGQIRDSGVYTAFGHHHIGLTGGAKTGRLLAELMTGERAPESLAAFSPDRF